MECSKIVYTCKRCRYMFEEKEGAERCPDCGSLLIRHATDKERAEFFEYQREFYPERFAS